MIQVGFLLLLCIAVVTANPPCVSTVKPAKRFDAAEFEGAWYLVRQITSPPRSMGTCETGFYTANLDGTLNVDIGWVDTSGVTQVLSGIITPSGANLTDGHRAFTYGDECELYTLFYLKHDTVFGGYTCIDDKAYVFVFARAEEVADSELGDLYKAMTDNGLDPKWLKLSPRTGCPAIC